MRGRELVDEAHGGQYAVTVVLTPTPNRGGVRGAGPLPFHHFQAWVAGRAGCGTGETPAAAVGSLAVAYPSAFTQEPRNPEDLLADRSRATYRPPEDGPEG